MIRTSLYFTAPREVRIRSERVDPPGAGEILVASRLSAVSAGTELLLYRNQFPPDLLLDETIPALQRPFSYPMKYGYAVVGQVLEAGAGVDRAWIGRRVFGFHPHESHFLASPEHVVPLPEGLPAEDAVLLPSMETAVNFLMDGRPVIGERVAIFGQGVVGLMTTALLARLPLSSLVTLDRHPLRRETSVALGARLAVDPAAPDALARVQRALEGGSSHGGADLVYEVSGNPEALNQAIAVGGFGARIVVGSWYGQKRSPIHLGGRFHRSRMHLVSSQVSTLQPAGSGAWTKARRLGVALEMIDLLRPSTLITHGYPFEQAEDLYAMLDREEGDVIQAVLVYDEARQEGPCMPSA